MLGCVYSLKKKKKKKKGDVTILCDTPYVRDVSALFGHGNKANRFHSTHGLPHVETPTRCDVGFIALWTSLLLLMQDSTGLNPSVYTPIE